MRQIHLISFLGCLLFSLSLPTHQPATLFPFHQFIDTVHSLPVNPGSVVGAEAKTLHTPEEAIYFADLETGYIGTSEKRPIDNPYDNIFHIQLPNLPGPDEVVYLEYDLFGVTSSAGIARSINDEQAIGGQFVQIHKEWTRQKELIGKSGLKKGDNIIRFGLPLNANYHYEVKKLSLAVQKRENIESEIVINSDQNSYGNQVYIKGALDISAKDQGDIKLYFNDQPLQVFNDEFEIVVDKPEKFTARLTAILPLGNVITREVSFTESQNIYSRYKTFDKGIRTEAVKQEGHDLKINLANNGVFASAHVPSGALPENKTISITALRDIDMPALNPDLVNVTKGSCGFRFLPHGSSFSSPVGLSIPFDSSLIPEGYAFHDIHTYYFDELSRQWMVLDPADSALDNTLVVSSVTRHFTDMINAIIKVPESPQTQGYVPTSIKDFTAADPTAEVTFIEPPSANNMGSASLGFSLKLPKGRQGMQPRLGLQYNNEGGNDWVGLGWSLAVSSIGIETRWGVPRYDPGLETETYILNGEQLAPIARDTFVPRIAERLYSPRVEGSFNKIIRHGTGPTNYWWEVTNKEGVRSFYGGTPTTGLLANAVLVDGGGNIGHWALVETRDLHNNFVRYQYDIVNDVGIEGGSVAGSQIYISQILYTGSISDGGAYKVDFIRDRQLNEQKRKDIDINCRLGFKIVSTDLLRKIKISFKNQVIRSYEMKYQEGAFYKSLLKSVSELDDADNEFYSHQFAYFDDVKTQPFGSVAQWTVPPDNVNGDIINGISGFEGNSSLLSSAKSKNSSHSLSLTLGIWDFSMSKSNTVGGSFGAGSGQTEGLVTLVDINADGLPDKVYKKGGALFYRSNLGPALKQFGPEHPIIGVNNFNSGKSTTASWGVEVNFFNTFLGRESSFTTNSTQEYFADFNGDGLIDIASNGQVFFNRLNVFGEPVFLPGSAGTPSPIISGSNINPQFLAPDLAMQDTLEKHFPLQDVIRFWEAPDSGNITVVAPVNLILAGAVTPRNDGVVASIQFKGTVLWETIIDASDFSIKNPILPSPLHVVKGDRLYFRLQSRYNGDHDSVTWNPVINYQNFSPIHDANGRPGNTYQASKDFILCNQHPVPLIKQGIVKIDGSFSKGTTSDIVKLIIIKKTGAAETIIRQETYSCSTVVNNQLIQIGSLNVNSGDSLKFILQSDSYIDRVKLQWNPHYQYTFISDGTPVLNIDGTPTIEGYLVPDNTNYNDWIIKTPLLTNGPPDVISVIPLISGSPSASGFLTFTVKGVDTIYGKNRIQLVNGSLIGNIDTIRITRRQSDTLFCEYNISDTLLAYDLKLHRTKFIVQKDSTDPTGNVIIHRDTLQAGVFTNPNKNYLGPLFRGWGHFSFKGDKINHPLDESKINANALGSFSYDPTLFPDTSSLNQVINAALTEFVPLYPDNQRSAWVGFDSSVYLTATTMGSSRLWLHDVKLDSLMTGASLTAADKISETNSTSYSLGLTLGGSINATVSNTTTKNTLDVMDMNGDRYPDVLHVNEIQFTLPSGGLEPNNKQHNLGEATFKGTSGGLSLGGSIPKAFAKNTSSFNAQNAASNAGSGIGISGNAGISINNDEVPVSWIDINGDGLQDKIYANGDVALNLGYKFTSRENWGISDIEKNKCDQLSGGVSLGYNTILGSFQGGFGVLHGDGSTSTSYEDINGDGLPDKLLIGSGTLTVQLNKGNGFGPLTSWNGLSTIRKNSSVGESKNYAVTTVIVFPVSLIPPIFLKFCINPSYSSGNGVSRENDQIADVDGDGFPDLLHSENDGNLTAALSTIGRTNMLSKVQRPFNSSFNLDYTRAGNTYGLPQNKWVLKSVEIFDGLKGDGVDTLRSSFSYSEGYYDRHEREFYGFGTVNSSQLNTYAGNSVFRTRVQHFLINNYYARGMLESEWLQDAAAKKYNQTNNYYDLRSVRDSVKFPALIKTEKLFYEGLLVAGVSTSMQFDYDTLGNVTQIIDAGDGNPLDKVTADVTYHHIPGLYIESIPSKIEVRAGTVLRRKRTTSIDAANGDIIQIRQFLDTDSSANTDMSYDAYGNLSEIKRPGNYKGQRLTYRYQYDDVVHTYQTKISDTYRDTSSSSYDFRFGTVTGTLSMNREKMQYRYDNRGRMTSLTGPYELAAGKLYTIVFDYHTDLNLNIPYSITHHYDPEYDKDINTITFKDGLGRAIQVKKQVSVFKGKSLADDLKMAISGHVIYDAFGRGVQSYYRTTEPLNSINNAYSNAVGLPESNITYDVLDRPVSIALADGATTRNDYSITSGQFNIRTTDANGNTKAIFTDVRGRTKAVEEYGGPGGTITTKFFYNGLSELSRVEDNNGNATVTAYDNLGRTVSVLHPDAGLTEYNYDLAGNLLKKITAQIRNLIPNGGAIQYRYDFERVTDIDYPIQYQNKVKYVYGDPSDSNHAGRLRLQIDASGGIEYFYGRLGEVTKVIRTILESPVHATTYVSEQEFDTWNRVKRMTYPDSEVVTYHYNQAGGLNSIDGYKSGNTYKYVEQLGYNDFEERAYLRYGNGTETNYSYDNQRRRLTTLQAKTATGRLMMNNSYTYDAVSNILSVVNNVTHDSDRLGGYAKYDYTYDNLYRLDSANGIYKGHKDSAGYSLKMTYDNLYNIMSKKMTDAYIPARSYDQLYTYSVAPSGAPHQVTQVGTNKYKYDLNGNRLSNGVSESFWDEENRLVGVIDNGVLSQYTYDAGGERVLKSSGGIQGIWVNGAPAGGIKHNDNYTSYVSPYVVCRRTSFTKHYYIESQRIATKSGYGVFTNISFPYPALTAGGIDYIKRAAQIEQSRKQYYASIPHSPGPPTMKDFYVWPENSGIAAPVIPDTSRPEVPYGWPGNTTPPPTGPPIHPDSIPNRDTVKAGYGFQGTGHFYEKDQYFYHPDHLGSTSYVTDPFGEVNQHVEYSAFGETLFEEHNTSFNSPYLFNAKEKDEETGLYYYGARYYDPKSSVWLSVDPMQEDYPGVSPYNYCLNNPIIYLDPDGRDLKGFAWAVVDYIPFAGSIKQIGEGIAHGDSREIALGVGMLGVDIFTAGEGGEVIRIGENIGKQVLEQEVKQEIEKVAVTEVEKGAEKMVAEKAEKEVVEKAEEDILNAGAEKIDKHHSDPKFMGGKHNQELTSMGKNEHKELHKDMNNYLKEVKDKNGNHMRPQRGNPGKEIQKNFSREERLKAVRDFYKGVGAKYKDAARDFFRQHPNLE